MDGSVKDRDAFKDAYMVAALWTGVTDDETPMDDAGYTPADFDDDSLRRIYSDCDAFIDANRDALANINAGQAGHDFWLTRNGHGAGFWDRGLGGLGEALTRACERFPEVSLTEIGNGQVEAL